MTKTLAEKALARIHALLGRWEARARSAVPVDTMLIHKHIRELREVLASEHETPGESNGC